MIELSLPFLDSNIILYLLSADAAKADKAEAIVAYRKQNGIFKAKEELQNVSGIGPQTFAKLESLITVK